MSIESCLPEILARLVQPYREALSPDVGCQTSAFPEWDDLSQGERDRVIAATRRALLDLQEKQLHRVSGHRPPVPESAEGEKSVAAEFKNV